MTAPRFTPSEIAAAAREARAGVEVELHKPDGSKIVVRPVMQDTVDADLIKWGAK